MRLLPYGPRAWLVELDEDDVTGFAAAVARAERADVVEIVPAARTVLVRLSAGAATAEIGGWLAALEPDDTPAPAGGTIEIPVRYDGEDLGAVAATVGLGVDEVVARHQAVRYTCAFCGFAPGFAYLRGLDPLLVLPRRPTPRTRVAAGSVAIAAAYTAVYPSASPGGWHLIGRTEAPLWDPARDPPALIAPGATVRFVPQ